MKTKTEAIAAIFALTLYFGFLMYEISTHLMMATELSYQLRPFIL